MEGKSKNETRENPPPPRDSRNRQYILEASSAGRPPRGKKTAAAANHTWGKRGEPATNFFTLAPRFAGCKIKRGDFCPRSATPTLLDTLSSFLFPIEVNGRGGRICLNGRGEKRRQKIRPTVLFTCAMVFGVVGRDVWLGKRRRRRRGEQFFPLSVSFPPPLFRACGA